MELTGKKILQILRSNLIILIAIALVGGIAGYFGSSYLLPKTYQSVVKIFITVSLDASTSQDINNSYVAANKIVPNCVEILETVDFKMQLKEYIGLDRVPELDASYDTENTTTVITVKTFAGTADEAYNIAQNVGVLGPQKILSMYPGLTVQLLDSARKPATYSSPNNNMNALAAAIILAGLFFLIAVIREMVGVKIKSGDMLTERYGYSVLAQIPDFELSKGKRGGKAT